MQATRLKTPKIKFVAGLMQEFVPTLATLPVTNPDGHCTHMLFSPYVFNGQAVHVLEIEDTRKYPEGQRVGAAVGLTVGTNDGLKVGGKEGERWIRGGTICGS